MNIRILLTNLGIGLIILLPLLSFGQSAFPTQPHTGNEETDRATYDKAKIEWIKQNPDEYAKMNGQIAVQQVTPQTQPILDVPKEETRTQVSKEALNAMTSEKQQIILGNPDMYLIVDGEPVPKKQIIDALDLLFMDTEVQNRILQRTDVVEVKKAVIDRATFNKMLPAQQIFITTHQSFYELN